MEPDHRTDDFRRLLRLAATLSMCLFVLVLVYLGAYFSLGTASQAPGAATAPYRPGRMFASRRVASFFKPAFALESAIRGEEVVPAWRYYPD